MKPGTHDGRFSRTPQLSVPGLADMITVRIPGDLSVRHGDQIYLTPQLDKLHKFDAQGLRVD